MQKDGMGNNELLQWTQNPQHCCPLKLINCEGNDVSIHLLVNATIAFIWKSTYIVDRFN